MPRARCSCPMASSWSYAGHPWLPIYVESIHYGVGDRFWIAVGMHRYRQMHVVQSAPAAIYVRLRTEDMPRYFGVVYRLRGAATVREWTGASAYEYMGTMTYDEADATVE